MIHMFWHAPCIREYVKFMERIEKMKSIKAVKTERRKER